MPQNKDNNIKFNTFRPVCQRHMCDDCPRSDICTEEIQGKAIMYKARLYVLLKNLLLNQAYDCGFCPEYEFISDILSSQILSDVMSEDRH